MQLTVAEVSKAFSSFKKENRVDHYGVCTSVLWNLFCATDVEFTRCLNEQISSSALAALWTVKGRFYSKVNGACFPRQTRAILPVPGTLAIVDTIIAMRCSLHLLRLPRLTLAFLKLLVKVEVRLMSFSPPVKQLKKEWTTMAGQPLEPRILKDSMMVSALFSPAEPLSKTG